MIDKKHRAKQRKKFHKWKKPLVPTLLVLYKRKLKQKSNLVK